MNLQQCQPARMAARPDPLRHPEGRSGAHVAHGDERDA